MGAATGSAGCAPAGWMSRSAPAAAGCGSAGRLGWRYADPHGGEHDVVNCSVAALELRVQLGDQSPPRTLRTDHGAAYELGMRERDHGVPIAPFADG